MQHSLNKAREFQDQQLNSQVLCQKHCFVRIKTTLVFWLVIFMSFIGYAMNRPFPSFPLPPCQNESKCETIHMKMSSAYGFIFMQIKDRFRS